jgi:hypothetical protein
VRVDGRSVKGEDWRRRQAAALVKLPALACVERCIAS